MKTQIAPPGAHVIDSYTFSQSGTTAEAQAFKARGVDAVALYLGMAKPEQVAACLAAGLAVFGVTFGGAFDGAAAVREAKALGLPAGTCLFLDVEGPAIAAAPVDGPTGTKAKIAAWAAAVSAAGYLPCIYVGVPQPFTSDELWHLPVVRYWRGQGSVRDRFGALAEPSKCGWCLTQMWPSAPCGGVSVDHDMAGNDYLSRAVVWAVA